MKNYKNLHRGEWTDLKIGEVINQLPNKVVSDIGAGFGWFKPVIDKYNLEWQPFDYVRKIDESTMWDLNNPVPDGMKKPGFIVFMEVLEHLANPELGLRNISNHAEKGAYMALTVPNPLSAQSKVSMVLNNALYAFQEKHLVEWHVFVPLPHVVKFHLENNGFEVLEMATIGTFPSPKFSFSLGYLKSLVHYCIVKTLIYFRPESNGHTQAFFVRKK